MKYGNTKNGKRKAESGSTRFIRCLSIIRRLQCHAALSVRQLVLEYQVGERSIQRDLNALSLAGYQIMPVGKGLYKLEPE